MIQRPTPRPALDTRCYDRSGNQIRRSNGFNGDVTEMIYPALSNRLDTLRTGATADAVYDYDEAGNRIAQIKPFNDVVAWQYDGLSRLVGSAAVKPGEFGPVLTTHFNACRWDAAWRLAQPCGNGGQLALMGANVTRSSLGWFFVHAPGIDEALLLIDRNDNFFMNKRLQAVTDGRGQLMAIADSSGQITEAYAGSGHDQSSWQGAGLTTQAQTFDPRKWETDETWGGIQQFRNRAYDPATGTWIQEDPMGVAGGVNVYRFNNGNPVSFGDPLGLMPCTREERKAGKETVASKGGLICVVQRDRDQPQEREPSTLERAKQCAADQLGLTALGGALAGAGANVLGIGGKFSGSTPGTSLASKAASAVFGDLKLPRALSTLTGFPGIGNGLKLTSTLSAARFAGRAVPVAGYAILAYDAVDIAQCVASDD